MRLFEFALRESSRQELYHGTRLDNAESILGLNRLEAGISFSREFGISLQFSNMYNDEIGVIFVFDNNTLRQDGVVTQAYSDFGDHAEREERNDQPITDLSKYIISIYVIGTKKLLGGLNIKEYPLIFSNSHTKIFIIDEEFNGIVRHSPITKRLFDRKFTQIPLSDIKNKRKPSIHKSLIQQRNDKQTKKWADEAAAETQKKANEPLGHIYPTFGSKHKKMGEPPVYFVQLRSSNGQYVESVDVESREKAETIYQELKSMDDAGTPLTKDILIKVVNKYKNK